MIRQIKFKSMFKKILIAIGVLIVVLVIVVAMQPADFRVTRSATINTPSGPVFERVNNFQKWYEWSPWEKLDPKLQRTYDGASEGEGAIYSWVGNKDVGEGRMTITESKSNALVRIKLEFIKPFAAVNTTEFTFTGDGHQTTVKWDMTGRNNFMSKAFCLFMSMDKMVGGDFEKGLSQLKTVAEGAAKTNTAPALTAP